MKPKQPNNHSDLFRSQLSQIIKLSHPLCRLATKINWDRLERKIDILYSEGAGQPPLPTRLMVGLHYLKYTFDEITLFAYGCIARGGFSNIAWSSIFFRYVIRVFTIRCISGYSKVNFTRVGEIQVFHYISKNLNS